MSSGHRDRRKSVVGQTIERFGQAPLQNPTKTSDSNLRFSGDFFWCHVIISFSACRFRELPQDTWQIRSPVKNWTEWMEAREVGVELFKDEQCC